MYRLILGVAVVSAVGSGAYFKGRSDELLKHQQVQAELSLRLHDQEQARLLAVSQLNSLREDLSNEALADPDAGRICFGAGSLHRLNQIE